MKFSAPIIKVSKLYFSYGTEEVLRDINFELFKTNIMGIVGPNGGGKTTLLKILVGLKEVTAGKIERNYKSIAYVPQASKIENSFPLSIFEILKLAQNKENLANIEKALERLDLKSKKDFLWRDLSGGEKQRTLIARSLMNEPDLLVLDEPSSALDSTGQDLLFKLLLELKKDAAIIIVDHNLNNLFKHCDRILCLNRTLHWHGPSEDVNQAILDRYYHCEFEHILIHENKPHEDHKFCAHEHHHGPRHIIVPKGKNHD